MIDLEELNRKYAAATQGQMAVVIAQMALADTGDYISSVYTKIGKDVVADFSQRSDLLEDQEIADAEFYVAIHNAFPAIVAKLEAADSFSNEVESEVTSFLGCGDDGVVGDANVVRAVQIMRAKLEAAQRLRDAVAERADCHLHSDVMLAIVQFDKEQQ